MIWNQSGPAHDTGIRMAVNDRPYRSAQFALYYSDINFELLGEIVSRVSGKTLPQYVTEKDLSSSGHDGNHVPAAAITCFTHRADGDSQRIALCRCEEWSTILRHVSWAESRDTPDLFSTAADLSKFAEMMLAYGRRKSVRIFSPLTVRRFTSPQGPVDQPVLRGLGWDIDSSFSDYTG